MHAHTSQLVVALDNHDAAHTLRLANSLKGIVPWVKVGLELFVHAGPDVVARLKDMGFKVFLDLKMFDIPNTVHGGILSGVKAGADMLTIHTLGGKRMAEAAAEAASTGEHGPLGLGITVLTSMAPGELPGYHGDLAALATDLAAQAQSWGLHGIVCSGHEARAVKERCGASFICLTPGIRPAAQHDAAASPKADDQRRVMTPTEAVAAGADYLVVGRPITQAAVPAEAARAIMLELTRTMV